MSFIQKVYEKLQQAYHILCTLYMDMRLIHLRTAHYHILYKAAYDLPISVTTLQEIRMANALVRKGKNCIALVESFCSDITRGSLDQASAKLTTLEIDGKELASMAERKAQELEVVEQKCQSQIEELQREIGTLGCEEEEITKRKLNVESTLSGQQAKLREMNSTLTSAENSLRQAERERREKEEEESERRSTGAIAGAVVFGIFTFGIGAPIGAAVGLGIGEAINQLVEAEETARK